MPSNLPYEPIQPGSEASRDVHRAIASLIEELQAIDAYQARVDVTPDDELRAVLAHNRDEEVEHAMMLLEWLRRRTATIDAAIRTFLLTDGPITEIEAAQGDANAAAAPGARGGATLGVGSLRAPRASVDPSRNEEG